MLLKDLINIYLNDNMRNFWSDKEFKPLISKYEETNMKYNLPYSEYSVCFNLVGLNFKAHPIIIVELENDYVFLKAKSIHNNINERDILNISRQKSYAIPKSKPINEDNNLFYFKYDSLIDTEQLFVMNKKEFNECYEFDSEIAKNTNFISDYHKEIILSQVINNINKSEFSLTRIIRKNGINHSKLLFAPDQWIKEEYSKETEWLKDVPSSFSNIAIKNRDYMEKYIEDYDMRLKTNKEDVYQKVFEDVVRPLKQKIKYFLDLRDDFLTNRLPEDFVGYKSDEIDYNNFRLFLYEEQIDPPLIHPLEENIYKPLKINKDEIIKIIKLPTYKSNPMFAKLVKEFNTEKNDELEM